MTEIFLGTIALEPNRWFGVTEEQWGTITLSDWLDPIEAAGFDGVELWESHIRDATDTEAESILVHPLPVKVFNTYVSFENEDDNERIAAAEWIRRSGAEKVKWNTGPDRDENALDAYGERLHRWVEKLPDVRLACECHDGSAMDVPSVAARVLAAGGDVTRSQAIVHSNDGHARLRAKFAAYGDRISHVHVNHLDVGSPPLAETRDDLASTATLLAELGFDGSWTIEFVHGTGGEADRPDLLLNQAIADLGVLREILD
jgi:sugar phosphate isomerase/epimerase